MAKTKAESTDKALIIFEGTDNLIQQAKEIIVADSIGTEEAIQELKDNYQNLVIGGIKDMAGYKAVKEGISRLKTIRTSIEKRRKELTEPALKFQREVKAEADRIVAEIKPLEDRLVEQKKTIDDAIEAERLALFQARSKELLENGYSVAGGFYVCGVMQVSPDQIPSMEDEEFQSYIQHGKLEIERKQAEEKRRAEEQERLRKEREALEAERAELARMRAEIEAQKQALEKTYETVVQPTTKPEPAPAEAPKESPDASFVQRSMEILEGKKFADTPTYTAPTITNAKSQQANAETPAEGKPEVGTLFRMGFDAFRAKALAFVSDENAKLTRAILKEWIQNVQP